MVRSLRDDERLTAEHEALVQLVLSTAVLYGEARRDPSTARYVPPKMAQAHRAAVLALGEAAAPLMDGAFERLMAEALRPTPGMSATEDSGGQYEDGGA